MPPRRKTHTISKEDDTTVRATYLNSWSVTELRDELKNRSLSPTGNKKQLINKLIISDIPSTNKSTTPLRSPRSDLKPSPEIDSTLTPGSPTILRKSVVTPSIFAPVKNISRDHSDPLPIWDASINGAMKLFSNMTVTQLREELLARELSPIGTKAVLLARLKEALIDSDPFISMERKMSSSSKSHIKENNNRVASPGTRRRNIKRSKSRSLSPLKRDNQVIIKDQKDNTISATRQRGRSTSPHVIRRAPDNGGLIITHHSSPTISMSDFPMIPPSPSRRLGGNNNLSPIGNWHPNYMMLKPLKSEADLGLFIAPLSTLALFNKFCWDNFKDIVKGATKSPFSWFNFIGALLIFLAINMVNGPHQVFLEPIQKSMLWYFKWFILGILSSVGLGTGAHTFLLFLGPFIARVTNASSLCRTLSFPIRGINALLCPPGEYPQVEHIALWQILNKVKWVTLAWGLGTAVGELPPYLVARASSMAGKARGNVRKIERIASKPRIERTWFDTAQLSSYYVVNHLGFWGILLFASIPNPLFDITGLTCGYYSIPFATFFMATILGKAIIKTTIQSAFLIFLFSQESVEMAVSLVYKYSPRWGAALMTWLLRQRSMFQQRQPNPLMDRIGTIWHYGLLLIMSYFVISVINSAAIAQARKEGILREFSLK